MHDIDERLSMDNILTSAAGITFFKILFLINILLFKSPSNFKESYVAFSFPVHNAVLLSLFVHACYLRRPSWLHHHHHHHHHLAIMKLSHFMASFRLTHPDVFTVVFLGLFCLLVCNFFIILIILDLVALIIFEDHTPENTSPQMQTIDFFFTVPKRVFSTIFPKSVNLFLPPKIGNQ